MMNRKNCILALLFIVTGIANADNVTFNVRSWDSTNMKVLTTTETKDATLLSGTHTEDWIGLGDGYYVVKGYVEYKALNITGSHAHLILEDGAQLYCKHVKLETGHSLSIYSQSDGDKKGNLTADNRGNYTYAAGIGGGDEATSGTLIVHGGTVEAHGYGSAAGIGGGDSGSCGDVIVYGGHVTGVGGKYAAGIGGGEDRGINYGNSVTIYGGRVEAFGNEHEYAHGFFPNAKAGAGIGGGYDAGQGGAVNIYGGEVIARSCVNGANIGGGSKGSGGEVNIYGGEVDAEDAVYAACIGGGADGNGGKVTIKGGTVRVSSDAAMSIGDGGGEATDPGTLTITGGSLYLKTSFGGGIECPITFGDMCVYDLKKSETTPVLAENRASSLLIPRQPDYNIKIVPCEHLAAGQTYNINYEADKVTSNTHTQHCNYCTYSQTVNHTYDSDGKCVCGLSGEMQKRTVLLNEADRTAGEGYETTTYTTSADKPFVLPVCKKVPANLVFYGWEKNPTGEDKDDWIYKENMEVKPAGEAINLANVLEETVFYARFTHAIKDAWKWEKNGSNMTATVKIHNAYTGAERIYHSSDENMTITSTELTDGDNNVRGTHYVATVTYTNSYNNVKYTFYSMYDDMIEEVVNITLNDNADNGETLADNDGKLANVTLSGRTFYKDGSWNTICLPFDLNADQLADTNCPLYNATIKKLESSSFSNGSLTLNFSTEPLTAIKTGKPYIVKWESGDDVTNPVFKNVMVTNEIRPTTLSYNETQGITFTGFFSPLEITSDMVSKKTILYLGASNKLYYPSKPMTIGTCRALFSLQGITVGELAQGAKSVVLNFGEDETTTGIHSLTPDPSPKGEGSGYYTLEGRRLNGMPTQKGIYIHNGNKFAIK